MKKLIPILFLIALIAVGISGYAQSVSDKEKSEIIEQHQALLSETIMAWESMNAEKVFASYANHPDFVEVMMDKANNYAAFKQRVTATFKSLQSFKISDYQYEYVVLSPTITLYKGKGTITTTYRNESRGTVIVDFIQTGVTVKSGSSWKIIQSHTTQTLK
jgi:hypothetical protein